MAFPFPFRYFSDIIKAENDEILILVWDNQISPDLGITAAMLPITQEIILVQSYRSVLSYFLSYSSFKCPAGE